MDFSETFLSCLLFPFVSLFIIFFAGALLKAIAYDLGYHNLYNNLGKLSIYLSHIYWGHFSFCLLVIFPSGDGF